MADNPASALIAAAQVIHAAAREHKRAEFAHRRQALVLLRGLDELRDECTRLGIELEITETKESE